jgi:hypothetical protein
LEAKRLKTNRLNDISLVHSPLPRLENMGVLFPELQHKINEDRRSKCQKREINK